MNQQFPDDFLSAFYDGELTPADAESLRKRLDETPEARRELDDFQRISQLLHELPSAQLGPEFRAQVMQAAEREMLIPATDAPTRRAPAMRRIWPGLIALTASAAALVMAVWLTNRHPQNDRALPEGAPSIASSSEATRFDTRETHAPMSAGEADARTADTSTGRDESAPVVRSKASTPQPDLPAGGHLASGRELVIKRALGGAKIGEVVEALEKTGDRISVVRLTVVDKQDGLNNLRVLLSRNGIAMGDGANEVAKAAQPADSAAGRPKADDTAKVTKDAKGPALGDEEFVCVLVEADTNQLTRALAELTQREEFRELRYDATTVAVASLNDHLPPEARLAEPAANMIVGKNAPAKGAAGTTESPEPPSAPPHAPSQDEKPNAAVQQQAPPPVPAPERMRRSQPPTAPQALQQAYVPQSEPRPSRQYQLALPANSLTPELRQQLARTSQEVGEKTAKEGAPLPANAAPDFAQPEPSARPGEFNRDGKLDDEGVTQFEPAEVADKKSERNGQAAAPGPIRGKQAAQNAAAPVQVLIIVEIEKS